MGVPPGGDGSRPHQCRRRLLRPRRGGVVEREGAGAAPLRRPGPDGPRRRRGGNAPDPGGGGGRRRGGRSTPVPTTGSPRPAAPSTTPRRPSWPGGGRWTSCVVVSTDRRRAPPGSPVGDDGAMSRTSLAGLEVDTSLARFVEDEALPGTGVVPE